MLCHIVKELPIKMLLKLTPGCWQRRGSWGSGGPPSAWPSACRRTRTSWCHYVGQISIHKTSLTTPYLFLLLQKHGTAFGESDIVLFEAFAIFCGIGIHNTKMYEGACKLMAKQKVALDCLSYHAAASDQVSISTTSLSATLSQS